MSTDQTKANLNVEGVGGGEKAETESLIVSTSDDGVKLTKADQSTQLEDRRMTARSGVGKKPPYDPDILASFIEKNETHSVAVRKKSRYEVGYGFDVVPAQGVEPEEASDDQFGVVNRFWRSRDSRWQTGPRRRAEPTIPEEVLELARQDYHAIGWCCLELLTDRMGRPVGLAHVPANTVRVRTPQTNYDRVRHPERGSFADPSLGEYASRGYVQVRHGKKRYFGEAGDRYRGQQVTITPGIEGEGVESEPDVRYLDDEGDDREPIFVDRETGDVALGDASVLDNDPANELIFVRNPSVLADDYGIPDWVSAIRTITADEAAKDYNADFFRNDTIPRFVIKVTGGTLSEESKKDLKEMLRGLREEDHRAVILEVDKFADGLAEDIQIELEPLGQGITEEMSFASFRTKNEHEVAKVHEVPPLLIGVTETSNRSNSKEQVRAFATEVIQPEQHKFAERLYQLIHQTAFGVTDWTIEFDLRGGDQPREDARTAREKISAVQGAIPVNRALEMIGEEPLDDERGKELVANVGSLAAPDGEGGGVESAEGRHPHAPPAGNKVGERDWAEVEERFEYLDSLDKQPQNPREEQTFDSSNLDQGVFDFLANELYLSFKRDGGPSSLYVYVNVPTSEWQGLVTASSHGSYHYNNVRLDYGYIEITNFHDRLPEGPLPEYVPDGVPSEI